MDETIQFDYYYGVEADQFSFYRVPRLLIKDERFKGLSSDAKLLYGLMLDRMALSRKNGWLDEQNRAYVIYTVENIMEDLGCAKATCVKIMKELDSDGGIGLGKVKTWACIQFILSTPSETITTGLLVGFLITLLVVAIYELRIVAFTMDGGRRHIKINIDGNNIRCSSDLWWMIAGTLAVVGTILASQLFSTLFFNITILRYLYVSYVIVWLVYSVGIARMKLARIWTAIFVAVILANCIPNYSNAVTTELSNNSRLKSTLEATRAEIDENDYIYTDIVHFAWTVASAYYPDTPHNLFGHAEWWGPLELSDLDPETDYWLFLSTPISESVIENLEDLDCTYEMVVEKGYIGTGNVWVYKVIQE